jgi:ZIP family zinc transporter
MIPVWLQAGLWGSVAGAALLLGALLAYLLDVPRRWVAAIMAFGSGVLISVMSLDLMEHAYRLGGFGATMAGFLGGAVVFTGANWLLARQGARHRKRSGGRQPSEAETSGSGLAIAVGALLDSVPETIVIGLSLLVGETVNIAVVVAIVLSNFPEGISSVAGMKNAGRPAAYIFTVWGGIALSCVVSAIAGYTFFRDFSPSLIGATNAVAAGAVLAMLVDTMIPEAFEETHDFAGLVTALGFLCGFILTKSA